VLRGDELAPTPASPICRRGSETAGSGLNPDCESASIDEARLSTWTTKWLNPVPMSTDPSAGRVNKLKGAYVLSRELEHGQTGAAADVDAADFLVSERGVEDEGGRSVTRYAVCSVFIRLTLTSGRRGSEIRNLSSRALFCADPRGCQLRSPKARLSAARQPN
jgi:hypothetical protein